MVQNGPRWSKLNCLLLTALSKLLNSIVSINKIKLEAQLLNSIVKSHFTNFGAWGNSNFFTIAFVMSKNHFVQKKKENRWRPCLTFFTITLFDNFSVVNSLYWNLLKRLKSTVSISLLLKSTVSMLPSCRGVPSKVFRCTTKEASYLNSIDWL